MRKKWSKDNLGLCTLVLFALALVSVFALGDKAVRAAGITVPAAIDGEGVSFPENVRGSEDSQSIVDIKMEDAQIFTLDLYDYLTRQYLVTAVFANGEKEPISGEHHYEDTWERWEEDFAGDDIDMIYYSAYVGTPDGKSKYKLKMYLMKDGKEISLPEDDESVILPGQYTLEVRVPNGSTKTATLTILGEIPASSIQVEENVPIESVVVKEGESQYFTFTPEKDGVYRMKSSYGGDIYLATEEGFAYVGSTNAVQTLEAGLTYGMRYHSFCRHTVCRNASGGFLYTGNIP